MPYDRFPNLLAMGRELVADRSANKVRAVGIKAFLYEQIDVAEVDVTKVDCDLFGFARSIAKPVNFTHFPRTPSTWMLTGCW
jgi:hypothetical protein